MLQLPLSLPQRLDPGASPRFAGVNLSGLAAAGLLAASLTGQLQAADSADVIAALGYTPTNAAVIPTGAPAAGQVLVGNAGGTAYARKTLTGDVTVDSDGVTAIGAARVVNSMLLHPEVTISGHSVALGASLALAQADVSGLTTASSPTFAGTTLSALANTGIIAAGTGGALRAATISDISFAAQANGLATLGGDGKLTGSQLPAIAITDTFVVASQAAMLALTAQTGDIAIRTDISTTFVLSGTDPSILGNWTQVLFNAPVTSVAGRTGAVTLANTDVGLAFVTNDAQTKASVVPNTLPSVAQILVGNAGGTAYAPKSVSGDGGITAAGVLTVNKLNGVSPGPFFDATNANILSGTLQAAQFPALTGDVTSSAGDLATSIAAGAVTLAKLANLPGDTFIGNATGSSATPTALTSGQATGLLATFVGDAGSGGTKGLVPAPSAGDAAELKYLAADGTWKVLAVAVGSVIVGTTPITGGTNARILYDDAGTLGEYTAAGAKSFLSIAYADVSGLGSAAVANLSATDKQFVYNDGGALGGSALMTFDKSPTAVYPIVWGNLGGGIGTDVHFARNFFKIKHLYTNPTPDPSTPSYHQVGLLSSLGAWAYTSADTTFTNKAIYGQAIVDATNTKNWTTTGYASLVGVGASVGMAPGSAGTIGVAACFSAIIAGTTVYGDGAILDQAVGFWADPGGYGYNYLLGMRATGLDHGVNNTGIYLGIDQAALPATGNWGIYDITGYASHFGGNIEIVGAVTLGAWNGTKVGLAYGGTNADLSATGGASQVLRQSTLGGAITVSALTSADVGLGNVDNTSDASKTATLVAATHTWALAQTFTTAPVFTDAAGTRSALGLGSVTNDAQTKASTVPNTAPAAGGLLVGNAGATAYAPVAMSGDATLASTGAIAVSKTGGVAFAASATTDTTNAANISSGTLPNARLVAVPNTALANSSVTIGTTAVALGASATAFQGVAKLYPSTDSTTAFEITKADGTTLVGTFDTTNSAFNIGPTSALLASSSKFGVFASGGSNLVNFISDGGSVQQQLFTYRAAAAGSSLTLAKSRGSFATPGAVLAGDPAGTVFFQAMDATSGSFRSVVSMVATVDTITGSDNVSGYYTINTRNDGSAAALTERVRVTKTGGVNIGAYSTDPGAGNLAVQNAITAGAWNGSKIGLAYGGTNADLSATGGTSQVLKQTSVGGAISVAQLAAADISGLGPLAAFQSSGFVRIGYVQAVDVSTTGTDTTCAISLPSDCTRYRANLLVVASRGGASWASSSIEIRTAGSGGGTSLYGTVALTGLTTNAIDTAGSVTGVNSAATGTMFDSTTLYIHVSTGSGVATTVDVAIFATPIPA